MNHLSPGEFADLVDGVLSEDRASHLRTCERCRCQAEELQAMLAATRDVEAPDPSPLFWDHLSSRIRAAVAAEPPARRIGSWIWRPAYGLAAAVAVVGLIVVTTWPPPWRARDESSSRDIGGSPERVALEPPAGFELGPADDTWEMVIAMTSDLQWDEAAEAGFGVRPGTADRLLSTLTTDERAELARILKTELPGGES